METRSCLITKIKNLIEIIRRSSSVKLIPKSVFHSFQRIFTLKIFYSQNSRTRIASIFPSHVQSKSPEITEKSFIAQGRRRRNREYTRNYNHPKNPAYLGGRSKEGRRTYLGSSSSSSTAPAKGTIDGIDVENPVWAKVKAPTTTTASSSSSCTRSNRDENRRARNNVWSRLASKVDDAPLLPPCVHARPRLTLGRPRSIEKPAIMPIELEEAANRY